MCLSADALDVGTLLHTPEETHVAKEDVLDAVLLWRGHGEMMEMFDSRLRFFFIAEIVALIGVIGDFLTTYYALGTGLYYEQHPQYSPLNAFTFWTLVNMFLTVLEPTQKWQTLRFVVIGLSWWGMIHNLLVLSGVPI